jgi:hypothetical protein
LYDKKEKASIGIKRAAKGEKRLDRSRRRDYCLLNLLFL